MPQLYHINHGCDDYREGRVVQLQSFLAPDYGEIAAWKQLEQTWNTKFPQGMSLWGLRLLYGQVQGDDILDREYDCELVRSRFFPRLPSRFQSLFALETLAEAARFKQKMTMPAEVWVVEPSGPTFRGDMNHLGYGKHSEATLKAYWRGEAAGDNPTWEWLLVPPVTLVGKVEEEVISAALGKV